MTVSTAASGDSGTPEELPAFVREPLERVARTLATAAKPLVDRWALEVNRVLEPAREWLREQGPKFAQFYVALQRYSAEAHVENWAGLMDEEAWIAALELMRRTDGVPIAWVPPADVVAKLVATPDHDARK